jgi:SOS response associated peptidase (SRAP)
MPGDVEATIRRPIAIHALEHLASSDQGVIKLRRCSSARSTPFAGAGIRSGSSVIRPARAETVATKPAYNARRCIIPASGFYEWKRDVEPKQPYYIHRLDVHLRPIDWLWEARIARGAVNVVYRVCPGRSDGDALDSSAV